MDSLSLFKTLLINLGTHTQNNNIMSTFVAVDIYTRTEFARQIGRTKQWVHDKVRRHLKYNDPSDLMELSSVTGEIIVARVVKSGSSILIRVEGRE